MAVPFFHFVWQQARRRLLFFLSALIAVLALRFVLPYFDVLYNWADPVITLLTLSLAGFVWYQQMREEWEEDYLPKFFSGSFYLNGKEIMRFEDAHLTTEGDIRQLAQQIGLQMSDPRGRLEFVPTEVIVSGPHLVKDKRIVHYSIRFDLTQPPGKLPPNTLRIWRSPFLTNGQPTFLDIPIK